MTVENEIAWIGGGSDGSGTAKVVAPVAKLTARLPTGLWRRRWQLWCCGCYINSGGGAGKLTAAVSSEKTL
jgi:hypothetical protein